MDTLEHYRHFLEYVKETLKLFIYVHLLKHYFQVLY